TRLVWERIAPGRQECMDRGRHLPVLAAFGHHCKQLFDEEWIPHSYLADPGARSLFALGAAEEVLDQLVGLSFRKWLERDQLTAPTRALVAQIRPCEAEEQEGCIAGPVDEMLHQVEERGLGPVDVLDDECERTLPRAPLECLPNRPEDLFRRTRGGAPASSSSPPACRQISTSGQ